MIERVPEDGRLEELVDDLAQASGGLVQAPETGRADENELLEQPWVPDRNGHEERRRKRARYQIHRSPDLLPSEILDLRGDVFGFVAPSRLIREAAPQEIQGVHPEIFSQLVEGLPELVRGRPRVDAVYEQELLRLGLPGYPIRQLPASPGITPLLAADPGGPPDLFQSSVQDREPPKYPNSTRDRPKPQTALLVDTRFYLE